MRTIGLEPEFHSELDSIAQKIQESRRAVFVTGAGISVSAGIPDFRSRDGLYGLVKQKYPDAVVKGRDLFDASVFKQKKSSQVFYTFMAGLRRATADAKPTPTHQFIRHLRDRKRLLRCYTQNIDGLEGRVGLLHDSVVKLHGELDTVKCNLCSFVEHWGPQHDKYFDEGSAPQCPRCREASEFRELQGKRATSKGILRPNVVLYGQEHPQGDAIGITAAQDARSLPDMLIIAGTSLKVDGLKALTRDLAKAVHANNGLVVFVNRTAVGTSAWKGVIDLHIQTDSDLWVADVRRRISGFWTSQATLPVSTAPRRIEMKPKIEQPVRKRIRVEDLLAPSSIVNGLGGAPDVKREGEPRQGLKRGRPTGNLDTEFLSALRRPWKSDSMEQRDVKTE